MKLEHCIESSKLISIEFNLHYEDEL